MYYILKHESNIIFDYLNIILFKSFVKFYLLFI